MVVATGLYHDSIAVVAWPADGDSSSAAAERLLLAKEVCKRMQGLLECMAVLVNTIFAMPAIVDQQVGRLGRLNWHCVQA